MAPRVKHYHLQALENLGEGVSRAVHHQGRFSDVIPPRSDLRRAADRRLLEAELPEFLGHDSEPRLRTGGSRR